MTKAELVNEISEKTGVDRVTVMKTVEAIMKTVSGSLIAGESVYLRGFGTFEIKHRAEKIARNISKNTSVVVPAHNIPSFKPSKDFVEKVKAAAVLENT